MQVIGNVPFSVVPGADMTVARSSKYKENLKSFSNNSSEDDKESNESDYDEDKDQLEEEQEEQTGKQ